MLYASSSFYFRMMINAHRNNDGHSICIEFGTISIWNIQDIYFYTPESVPVSAIGNTGYSGTNRQFWNNRCRFP